MILNFVIFCAMFEISENDMDGFFFKTYRFLTFLGDLLGSSKNWQKRSILACFPKFLESNDVPGDDFPHVFLG